MELEFLLLLPSITILGEEGGERHFSKWWSPENSGYTDSSFVYGAGSNLAAVSSTVASGKT